MEYEIEPSLYWRIRRAISSFGATEKILFGIFSFVFIVSAIIGLQLLNRSFMTDVPVRGGTIEEGIVGFVSTINPVLAYTDADKDMTSLIYSGLLKVSSTGELLPDIAESWTQSENGLTYDVLLKPEARFHDGYPVTADDIIFTIEKVMDPEIDSPRASDWAGVTVTKINETHVRFTLRKAYAPFLENLTLGILPQHIWNNVASPLFSRSTYNQEPIGSGPYKIKSTKNSEGFYEYYDLIPFDQYLLGAANIDHLIVRFYKDELAAIGAYNEGTINALGGISAESVPSLKLRNGSIKHIALPRVFAIFFNQSQDTVLLNKEVRQALDAAIDRDALIKEVLQGYGIRATGPIPAGFISKADLTSASSTIETASSTIQNAQSILTSNGWSLNSDGFMQKNVTRNGKTETQVLKVSISTSNVPELRDTAAFVQAQWKLIGVDVTLNIYEPTDLSQKVIRPRKYDALLFGNVVGKDVDVYPFWHSSQRNDPGLNIAMYANVKTDKLLETARTTASTTVRNEALQSFETEIANDIPAVFLYSPEYIYVIPRAIRNAEINNITSASDRFMSVYQWFIETQGVWNIFINK